MEHDRAARLFLFRGNLDEEFASYHPRAREILTTFSQRINAFVDEAKADASKLPVEFRLTGTEPGYWSPTSSLIRIYGITRNGTSEVLMARRIGAVGLATTQALTVNALRYMVHLNAPGWNVIGAGEPALPGVSTGHNERIAFGLTIFAFGDEEDLYVYDLNPADPSQYRCNGAWESMRVVKEPVGVRGQATPTETDLRFPRHRPPFHARRKHGLCRRGRQHRLVRRGAGAHPAARRRVGHAARARRRPL